MEKSGLIESDCKAIILFEKAQIEESHTVVISREIQHGSFCSGRWAMNIFLTEKV